MYGQRGRVSTSSFEKRYEVSTAAPVIVALIVLVLMFTACPNNARGNTDE